jgi:hypothetical protein
MEASATFTLVLRPTAPGSFTNVATVTASQFDPASANNTSSLMVTVNATPAGTPVQRYRLYSDVTKEHHFTTDLNEYNVLGSYTGTWVQGGVGKVLDNPGSFGGVTAVPYYRLYDTNTRWHHWTTDINEYYTLTPGLECRGVDILPTQATGTTSSIASITRPWEACTTGPSTPTSTARSSRPTAGSRGGSGFVVNDGETLR